MLICWGLADNIHVSLGQISVIANVAASRNNCLPISNTYAHVVAATKHDYARLYFPV